MADNPPHGLMLKELVQVEGFVSPYLGLPRREDRWWLLLCENDHGGRCTLAGSEEGLHRYVDPFLGDPPSPDDDRWDVELGPEVLLGFELHALGWVSEWIDEGDWSSHWSFHG